MDKCDTETATILVTGASGFVGQMLVPRLVHLGFEVIVIGRNKDRLRELYPEIPNLSYDELFRFESEANLLIHLATANNSADINKDDFTTVNVNLTLKLANYVRTSNVRHFINVTSVHALKYGTDTPYATSKRSAINALAEISGLSYSNLFLPAVYGDRYSGNLSVLNRFTGRPKSILFEIVAAYRPTVNIDKLVAALSQAAEFENLDDIIITDGQSQNTVYKCAKRAIDISAAAFIIFFFWWLLVLLWLIVKISSPGPAIFAQKRVGRFGFIYTCYKFRTMRIDTDDVGTHEVPPSSVTSVGRFLRKTKLDELPQVLNLLFNDMSLVGPRPSLPMQTELNSARKTLNVDSVKPGITGLAQINGVDMSTPHYLSCVDAEYVSLQSINLDLRIIIATAFGKGQGDKVVNSSPTNG